MSNDSDDLCLNQICLPKAVAVLGKGMLKNNALLSATLRTQVVRRYPVIPNSASDAQAYIGWGNKKSYQRAKRVADKQELPVYSIEDGFLRSIDSGINSRYALSMIVDDLGIYYDSTEPSRLETMICQRLLPQQWSAQHIKKSQQLISTICNLQLSKYNDSLACADINQLIQQQKSINSEATSSQSLTEYVLLIDQVLGDKSLAGACVDERSAKKHFKKMLKDVFKNHPQATILIKAHPAGKTGYLTANKLIKLLDKYKNRLHVLTESVNSIALLKQVQHVYTVSSHMGFESLLLASQGYDIKVHCYGVSWYAGWGVTDDSGMTGKVKKLYHQVKHRRLAILEKSLDTADRNSQQKPSKPLASIEQLFFSAYLDYSHYVDPATKATATINEAVDWLATNRQWHNQFKGNLTVYEFSRWKLPFVRAFVNFPKTALFIKPKPRLKNLLHPDHYRVNMDNPLLVWGLAQRQKVESLLNNNAIDSSQVNESSATSIPTPTLPVIYCMEDGFIRSNGLGATLLAPLSVVIDQRGIYYNATQASDLEYLLQNCQKLTTEQTQRVETLQELLLARKVSKYNVGQDLADVAKSSKNSWIKSLNKATDKKLLIVGQVEDDLSVQYCGSVITTNAELIQRVSQDNPDAFLLYKPHPDVEAGLRQGKVNKSVLQLVDAVASNVAMPDCLSLVDEVHTISSLTGFEGLLRGKEVTCYGLPFYAGWGLTKDVDSQLEPKKSYLARRKRPESSLPLSLQQLIHCTLIDYPIYRLPDGYGLAQVEQVIDYLYRFELKSEKALDANMDTDSIKKENQYQQDSSVRKTKGPIQQLTNTAKTRFMQARHQFLLLRKKK